MSSINNIVNYTPARKILSPNEYYNLFINFGEKYDSNVFYLKNDRIFEYTNTAIIQRSSQFTLEEIDEIIRLPVLLLPEYRDSNQDIKIGFFW